MSRLLSAGFTRLWKARVFHVGMIVMAGCGLFFPLMNYIQMEKYGVTPPFDCCLFYYILLITMVLSVFISLFLGTEYSDGTIRNKLIVGHKRCWIYLSNLIVCMTAAVLMQLIYVAVYSVMGLLLFDGMAAGILQCLYIAGAALLLSFAYTAIYTTIAMLCQNKALSAIICVMGMFLLFFAATYIKSALSEPEAYEAYTYTDNTGTYIGEPGPNPYYVSGTKRQIYKFLLDFLPAGQMVQLTSAEFERPERLPAYSVVIFLVATLGGIGVFRRKDLK